MDILYREGEADVHAVLRGLPDPPSYSAVRTLLRLLEEKGHARHKKLGRRYVYRPVVPREKVRGAALRNVLSTFFGGSVEAVVASLLGNEATELADEQYDRLAEMIERARREGR